MPAAKSAPPSSTAAPSRHPARKVSGLLRRAAPEDITAAMALIQRQEDELAYLRGIVLGEPTSVPVDLIEVGAEYTIYLRGDHRVPAAVTKIYTSDDDLDDKLYQLQRTDKVVHQGPPLMRRSSEIYPPMPLTLPPPSKAP